MKKLFAFALFAAVIVAGVFGQNIPKGSKVVVVNQNNNLSGTEASWLPGAVRDKLESDLQTYTDFSFIAADASAVLKLQKQSGGAAYSESDAIELGKMSVAKYAVFVTLRKSGGYTVVADVTDLTTGQKFATAISGERKTANELFSTTGCAADELTVMLCDKLKIVLSNTQRYSLMHGEKILSNDEQVKMVQEVEKAFKNAIAKYDAEIKRLSASTDLNSVAAKAKMEADKALAQEKLRASQERARRLEAEAKKAAADKEEDAARTEEQIRRRDRMAKEAAERAAIIRNNTLSNESVFTKIGIIENKKKALLEIQKSMDRHIAEIKKEGESEYAKKKAEIENAPYRAAEKNPDGTPSTTAKERRQNQIKDLRKNIDNRVNKEIKNIKLSAVDNAANLYNDIKSDQEGLSKVKGVSSLGDDLRVQTSVFNGTTNSWKITFWLYSNGIPITSQSVNMTYTDLTGKEIDTSSDGAYNEFMDTVDLYNSLFSRGEPVLTYKLNYWIESVGDSSSKYKIKLGKLDVIDTVSNRTKCNLKIANVELPYQMNPVYNIKCELVNEIVKKKISEELAKAFLGDYFDFRRFCEKNYKLLKLSASTPSEFYLRNTYKYIEEIEIPEGVSKICGGAFEDCVSLKSVTMPDGVREISGSMFFGCTSLTSITIPNSVREIGERAFRNCTSLTSVTIPNSVQKIGQSAFRDCTSLKSVIIQEGVSEIDGEAFEDCTSLVSITIPNSIRKIGGNGYGAFWNCTSLSNVVIKDPKGWVLYSDWDKKSKQYRKEQDVDPKVLADSKSAANFLKKGGELRKK